MQLSQILSPHSYDNKMANNLEELYYVWFCFPLIALLVCSLDKLEGGSVRLPVGTCLYIGVSRPGPRSPVY